MSSHLDHLKDLFATFGDITIRKMFGGAGVYCDGVIFAIADDEDVWLKVDDVTRAEFEEAGLNPFEVEMKGKTGTMSYYKPPAEIYDDEDALRCWTTLALGAASRAKKPAKTAKKQRSTKKPVAKQSSEH
ncbi:MAG: TfoX/Sxy family protein [Pseudomonadota bacterium]